MKRTLRKRLVWRLYAIGLVQFALVLLSGTVIGYVWLRLPQRWDMPSLSAHLRPIAPDRAALSRELARLRDQDRLLISLYGASDELLGSNVFPPLRPHHFAPPGRPPPRGAPPGNAPPGDPPPGDRDGRHPLNGGPPLDSRLLHAPGLFEPPPPSLERNSGPPPLPDTFARFEFRGGEGLLIARFEQQKPSRVLAILTLLASLLVLGVGAFLTARWIARPLSHLSSVAASLGQGDLRARSELTRNDEVGDVARAFDEMAERIQRLLRTEKELLANVAHELRTPLARIRVALELASEGDAETARASLAEIAVDLNELEALISDVFTAARFNLAAADTTNAVFALRREQAAPRAIAERAVESFVARHPARPLSCELDGDLPNIEGDPKLLRRALDNVLENAHKYSPDPATPITLRVSAEPNLVCFAVRDQGLGIPKSDLAFLFDAFFRTERSRSRGGGGVGLGLTLVQRIVEAHGGRVEVDSEPGQGSTFRLYLPA